MAFLFHPGILGMNARNLLYIRPYNRKQAVQLADSKLKTKLYLSTRGIAVPKLYATVKSKKELDKFDWSMLPKSFVIKPNRGFGGEGIKILTDFDAKDFSTVQDLLDHINDILDGHYSLSNAPDSAILEQRIVSHPIFDDFAYQGLPDIRIIVHNLVPVMAMLRLPTRESGGKANLHAGGAIVGVDIGSGECTYSYYKNRVVEKIPGSPRSIRGLAIPNWDAVLLTASKAQLISNLGYMAIDIVLDKNETPIVLELNARGGLGIQIANLAPLRKRLERIQGIKVASPAKGVQIGKYLFGHSIEKEIEHLSGKEVLGNVEALELLLKKGDRYPLVTYIDTGKSHTSIDYALAKEVGLVTPENDPLLTKKRLDGHAGVKVEFMLGRKRIKTVATLKDYSKSRYKMLIGRRDLTDFLIDPLKEVTERPGVPLAPTSVISVKRVDQHVVDRELCAIDEQLKLLFYMRPTNLVEERERFIAGATDQPHFAYRPVQFSIEKLKATIASLDTDRSPLGQLFEKKKQEQLKKLTLLERRGSPAFTAAAIDLYGEPHAALLAQAEARLSSRPHEFVSLPTKSSDEVKVIFEGIFKDYGLHNWKVVIREDMGADCSVGKTGTLFLKKTAVFSEPRLLGTIAHEIDTHILTAENGKTQAYKIFQWGFADYLTTQEGLAVYNEEHIPNIHTEISKYYWTAANVVAVHAALSKSFREVYDLMQQFGFGTDRSFQFALKAKRGLADTGQPGAFTKQHLYLRGMLMVDEFVKSGGDLKKLYLGKVALGDLELIQQIPGLVPPKYLPRFLA